MYILIKTLHHGIVFVSLSPLKYTKAIPPLTPFSTSTCSVLVGKAL